VRADVFRFTAESGHRATHSVCPFRANNGSRAHSTDFAGRSDGYATRIMLMVRIGLSVTLLRDVSAEPHASAKAASYGLTRVH
jgi:hypothetical protein